MLKSCLPMRSAIASLVIVGAAQAASQSLQPAAWRSTALPGVHFLVPRTEDDVAESAKNNASSVANEDVLSLNTTVAELQWVPAIDDARNGVDFQSDQVSLPGIQNSWVILQDGVRQPPLPTPAQTNKVVVETIAAPSAMWAGLSMLLALGALTQMSRLRRWIAA